MALIFVPMQRQFFCGQGDGAGLFRCTLARLPWPVERAWEKAGGERDFFHALQEQAAAKDRFRRLP